jgi:hypothetical protein
MTPEEKNELSNRSRISVISGHRRRMVLCIKCGKDIHDGECIENYTKADCRENNAIDKKPATNRKKETVISYRKRKGLCTKCGHDLHDGDGCLETYEVADNRDEDIKRERPSTIQSPKFKPVTILDDIERTKDLRIDLEPTETIKLQRDFIVVDIRPSSTDNRVEFSCLEQLSKKFKDYIICIIGDSQKTFAYSDFLKMKRFVNIHEIQNQTEQTIVNYVCSSKKYFGFDDRYTSLCLKKNISFYVFQPNKNATSKLLDLAYNIPVKVLTN